MTLHFRAAVLALALSAHGTQLHAQTSRGALASDSFAITGVSIIPMTRDTLLSNATVMVQRGRITSITTGASARIPAGVRRIDGSGKFLIPGLADMHTHLYSDEQLPDSLAAYELGVMLANGITTARLMIGTPEHLGYRRDIESGRMLGPQLWIASPQFAGRPDVNARLVATAEQARAAVREVAAAGYDFVKLTVFISREVYDAVVDEAAKIGIRVVGHVDAQVGVMRALEARQQIEHHDNYMESILADSSPIRTSVSDRGVFQLRNWESLDYVDDRKLEQIAGATARAGVFTTPTLHFFTKTFAEKVSDEELASRPDWTMIPPATRALYMGARTRYWANPPSEARRRRYIEVRNRLVKAITDSGGKIMAGSDAPGWLLAYGFTIHRELESLVLTGLTPYQALRTATVHPAEFIGATREWGTIEVGQRADMVLLDANPLADIRATSRVHAVSIGGRWLPKSELSRMISEASKRISAEGGD